VYVVHENFEAQDVLMKLIKNNAEKVILIDSDFPIRWLLDLNFEIAYRQSNILVFRKID
jgi:uncharacterized protein